MNCAWANLGHSKTTPILNIFGTGSDQRRTDWRGGVGGQRGYIFGHVLGDECKDFSKNETSLTPFLYWWFLEAFLHNLKFLSDIPRQI
jgi:hypothetical protein